MPAHRAGGRRAAPFLSIVVRLRETPLRDHPAPARRAYTSRAVLLTGIGLLLAGAAITPAKAQTASANEAKVVKAFEGVRDQYRTLVTCTYMSEGMDGSIGIAWSDQLDEAAQFLSALHLSQNTTKRLIEAANEARLQPDRKARLRDVIQLCSNNGKLLADFNKLIFPDLLAALRQATGQPPR